MNAPAAILRFPPRHSGTIWVTRSRTEWLVLAGPYSWSHGDRNAALQDARWLPGNLSLPIRESGA
jgi:hypothetical protein